MAKIRVGRSPIHGRGVFAAERIRRGTRIGRFEGTPTDRDGTYVLWVLGDDDEFRGIRGTTPLRFLNHAADPNAEFREADLFALRGISPGEEITCHYGEAWDEEDVVVEIDARRSLESIPAPEPESKPESA